MRNKAYVPPPCIESMQEPEVRVLYSNRWRPDKGVVEELLTENGVRITIRNDAYFDRSYHQEALKRHAMLASEEADPSGELREIMDDLRGLTRELQRVSQRVEELSHRIVRP